MKAKKTAENRKEELVTALRQVRRQMLDVASGLPTDKHEFRFLGTWSVNDLVAHFVGWDFANLAAVDAIRAGRLPDFYARYDTGWRTFNAGLVSRYKCERLSDTIAAAEASHEALIAHVHAAPAEEIVLDRGVRSPGGRRVTIEMILSAEAGDERVHLRQLEEFART